MNTNQLHDYFHRDSSAASFRIGSVSDFLFFQHVVFQISLQKTEDGPAGKTEEFPLAESADFSMGAQLRYAQICQRFDSRHYSRPNRNASRTCIRNSSWIRATGVFFFCFPIDVVNGIG